FEVKRAFDRGRAGRITFGAANVDDRDRMITRDFRLELISTNHRDVWRVLRSDSDRSHADNYQCEDRMFHSAHLLVLISSVTCERRRARFENHRTSSGRTMNT